MIRRPPRSTPFPCTPLFRATRLCIVGSCPSMQQGIATLGPARRRHSCDTGGKHPVARRWRSARGNPPPRSEEHTPELQSRQYLVCRPLVEKKNQRSLYPAFL